MVETIQTDIFARAMRMMGHEAYYLCADDTHGTPIEISAHKQGITPEALIAASFESHTRDFAAFGIHFEHYYTTHSKENQDLANAFFESLRSAGHIEGRVVKQLFSPAQSRFLPDRYVKGKCPKCKAADQYGDVCESCKTRYDAIELIDPICVIDGSVPEVRESNQLFLTLDSFTDDLRRFAESDAVPADIRNYVLTWLNEGLQAWNISRDKPYFGFEIPGYPEKYFYVWMDAPIGYIATTQAWCEKTGESLDKFWKSPDTEIWHFIGKDIIYFHALFWPAMLKAAGYQMPHRVHAHGFLTVNGQKMSKSRGTFILASQYLKVLPPAYLRYYFAAKLSTGVEDIDLNIEDFYYRVRSGLIDNIANLHNRSFSFAETKLDGRLSQAQYDDDCRHLIVAAKDTLRDALAGYERLDTAYVVRKLTDIGDKSNLFYQEKAPWTYLKGDDADREKARAIVTACAETVRLIAIGLKPIAPDFSAKIFAQLGISDQNMSDIDKELNDSHRIANVEKTYIRPERDEFDALTATVNTGNEVAPAVPGQEDGPQSLEADVISTPPKENIEFSQFEALDIRVGLILSCEKVKKSNKLLCSQVDIGHPDGPVQIVSGIAKHYDPSALVGRKVLVLTNLAPRTMFGLESRGMILAASDSLGLELPGCLLRAPGSPIS